MLNRLTLASSFVPLVVLCLSGLPARVSSAAEEYRRQESWLQYSVRNEEGDPAAPGSQPGGNSRTVKANRFAPAVQAGSFVVPSWAMPKPFERPLEIFRSPATAGYSTLAGAPPLTASPWLAGGGFWSPGWSVNPALPGTFSSWAGWPALAQPFISFASPWGAPVAWGPFGSGWAAPGLYGRRGAAARSWAFCGPGWTGPSAWGRRSWRPLWGGGSWGGSPWLGYPSAFAPGIFGSWGAFGPWGGSSVGEIGVPRVYQTAPSKASGNYYAPSTVDTTASGSYYAQPSQGAVQIIENQPPPADYWGPSGNPFADQLEGGGSAR